MRQKVSLQLARLGLATWIVAAFGIVALASICFVTLASEMREGETLGFDRSVLLFLRDNHTQLLDSTMPILTDVGGGVAVAALALIVTALFVYKKQLLRASIVIIGVSGAAALNLIAKSLFMRERPDLWTQLVHEAGYSFPSGHAMMSSALAVALVVALWYSRWRLWAIVAAIIYALFVGFSRLYLGVHYPTDIIAGWLVSVVWVVASASLLRSRRFRGLFATK